MGRRIVILPAILIPIFCVSQLAAEDHKDTPELTVGDYIKSLIPFQQVIYTAGVSGCPIYSILLVPESERPDPLLITGASAAVAITMVPSAA